MARTLHRRNRPIPKPDVSLAILDPDDSINVGRIAYWPLGDVSTNGLYTAELSRQLSTQITTNAALDSGPNGGFSLALSGTQSASIPAGKFNFLETTPFSGVIWSKATSDTSNHFIFGCWNILVTGGWVFSIGDIATHKLGLTFADFNGGNNFSGVGGTTVDDGIWRLLGFSYDGSGSNTGIKLYVNGLPETVTGATAGTGDPGALTDSGIFIGRRGQSATGPGFYIGSLSDGSLWNRYLSANEHARLYNEPYVGISEQGAEWLAFAAVAAGTPFASGQFSEVGLRGSRRLVQADPANLLPNMLGDQLMGQNQC